MFVLPPTRLRRTLDAVVAFATLADAEPAPHPHRRPLRSCVSAVPRRAGAVRARPAVCRAPVASASRVASARGTSSAATR